MNAAYRRLTAAMTWLAVFLIAAKAWYLLGRGTSPAMSLDYARALAAISYADVEVLIVSWLALGAAAAFCGARTNRNIGAVLLAAAAAVAYAFLNVALFGAFGGYLTASLVVLLPRVAFLRAAAAERLPASAVFVTILAAGLYVAAVAATLSASRFERLASSWRVLALAPLAVLAVVWIGIGAAEYRRQWSGHQDRRAAESAHWLIVRSAWRAVLHGVVRPETRVRADDLLDFSGASGVQPPAAAPVPPNVVLIVLESVGERWTSLGGRYDTTPLLAGVAQQGAAFSSIYAHVGRSSDALVALLLSRYPKFDFRDITDEYPRLAGTSLASVLNDRGYRTEYATSSDFAWASWRQFLEGRGFDRLVDYHGLTCAEPLSEWGVEDRCLVDEAVRFVGENRDRPFFFMGWTTQTHYPYEPTPGLPLAELAREPGPDAWDLNRYLNVLRETDRQIERLFAALDRSGLTDRTLTIVLGDHGQSFGYPHDSYGQGRTAFEEDVHIPLVIRGPGLEPSSRPGTIGAQVDVAPTVAALAGVPNPPDWQGRSLFSHDRSSRAYFFVAEDHFTLGVREGGWKYLWDLREGTEQLFDLAADPDEQRNLSDIQPARASQLRRHLSAWMEANRRTYFLLQ